MTSNKVVIVSDSEEMRESLERLISQAGFDAETKSSLEVSLLTSTPESISCLVLDTVKGDLKEPGKIAAFQKACALQSVLVLIHVGDIPTAVQAIRQGAANVIQKPVKQAELLEGISKIFGTGT